MKIVFTERAKKEWRHLNKLIQNQIRKKLVFYAKNGNILKFAEKLKDYSFGEYRFRIGDYRLIFDFRDKTIIVLKVGHRKDIYR
ncbi:MAG: type II toxin-antitoxin system RelE/ParE family toxin [Candidatus Brennerbacteria bacterium]|nr:type II toxin-antitoxin system RelE/ParE family toxin [Candidatus Brennerbacteria bacterium]